MSQPNSIRLVPIGAMKLPDFSQENSNMPNLDNSGGPPHDGGMDARVAKLEEFVGEARTHFSGIENRLVKIETRLDGIDGRMATKADLHEMSGSMIKWMVGTAVGLGVAAITVMTFVLNNATPKAPSGQPTPIIIQVPMQAPTAVIPAPTVK